MAIVSCEHATPDIPEAYRDRFVGAEDVLASHRGWDPGSLPLAEGIASRLRAPLLLGRASRLLIEMNRSPDNPARWSEFTASLPETVRESIGREWFIPYFTDLREAIDREIAFSGFACHLSIHTFTRRLREERREVDIGVLFDPGREPEASIAGSWIGRLRSAAPDLETRPNEPYLGTDDGLTTLLRKAYPPSRYAGIELEVCQSFFLDQVPWRWERLMTMILETTSSGADFRPGSR